MIYCNKGEVKIGGTLPELMTDILTALEIVVSDFSEVSGETYKKSLEFITTGIIKSMLEAHEECNGMDRSEGSEN